MFNYILLIFIFYIIIELITFLSKKIVNKFIDLFLCYKKYFYQKQRIIELEKENYQSKIIYENILKKLNKEEVLKNLNNKSKNESNNESKNESNIDSNIEPNIESNIEPNNEINKKDETLIKNPIIIN